MPPASDDKSPLARARERLYAPTGATGVPVSSLKDVPLPPAEHWESPPPPPPPKKPGLPRSTLFLIIAAGFFVVAVVVAAALILFGGRTVSTENIEIEVTGSTSIGSGDTVPLLITVRNRNPVAITDTTLSVDFPDGTRAAGQTDEPLSHYSDTVGDLSAGESADRTVQAVIFGSEGQKVTLPIRFEYRTEGSNNPFIKEAAYELTITTSPLSISVGTLSQVSAGQPFTVAASVRSNAPAPIANAALLVEYPPGFVPSKTSPSPVSGSLFDLGTLSPGEERIVSITGTLSGENLDTRVFRFTSGVREDAASTALSVSYTTTQAPITLERPFLSTTLSINRDPSADLVLKTGQQLDGVISWINTLSESVRDAQITIAFSGSGLDQGGIQAANGFYRSSDATITYSKETVPAMSDIAPGETGMGNFRFATKGGSSLASLRNPSVTFTVSVAGRRLNERNVPTLVTATLTRTLKVETDLALSAQALRTAGPLNNTGPWPPTVDTESTYTVAWALSNSVNSVANARVTATLPSYVRFTGASSPADGSVTYNATTRVVTWNASDIPAGTTAKTVYFQVALVPSASQRGQSPVLVTGQTAVGADRFTETRLETTAGDLTTIITNDPAWTPARGQVQ